MMKSNKMKSSTLLLLSFTWWCSLTFISGTQIESTADKVEKRLEVTTLIGEATAFDEHIENDQEALEEPSNSLNIKAVDSENELGSTDNKHSSTPSSFFPFLTATSPDCEDSNTNASTLR